VPDGHFTEFLCRSFETLEGEMPHIYTELCGRLAGRKVSLQVEKERVGLLFGAGRVRMYPGGLTAEIALNTSCETILALVDAELTLLEALLRGDIHLLGGPADVAAFHDGLMLYLHGAVRAPSFPALLRRFRAKTRSAQVGARQPAG